MKIYYSAIQYARRSCQQVEEITHSSSLFTLSSNQCINLFSVSLTQFFYAPWRRTMACRVKNEGSYPLEETNHNHQAI